MGDVLKKGSKGQDVSALQGQLNKLGYGIAVDGDYGDATASAVQHLQKSFGYTVDGMVGDATRALITQQMGYGWNKNSTG